MKNSFICLYLSALAFGLLGCSNDDAPMFVGENSSLAAEAEAATVTTLDAKSLGNKTIRFYISTSDGIRTRGVVFSTTNAEPNLRAGQNAGRVSMAGNDSTDRANLSYATYYYRAYGVVVNSETSERDTLYGDVKTIDLALKRAVMESYPIFNRVRIAAIVAGRFIDKGDATEWGAVISESVNPTYNKSTRIKAPDYNVNNGDFGVFFDNLKPEHLYHTRIYARYPDGTVDYGEDRIFKTTKGANISWRWASNEAGAKAAITNGVSAYDRITEAMDSAVYHYYFNYTNVYLRPQVEYNTGVQTADCSFGGWIRYGPNTRYQWVGTAMHEMDHGLGGGTSGSWGQLMVNGSWSKPLAQLTTRVMFKDQTQVLRGDGQHWWNGGINQREEVTNGTTNSYGVTIRNADGLKANAMIMNAMMLDGLAGPRP